jgi:hypothetical protein
MPQSMVETYLLLQKDKPSNATVNGRLTSLSLTTQDKPSNASVNGRDIPLTPEG